MRIGCAWLSVCERKHACMLRLWAPAIADVCLLCRLSLPFGSLFEYMQGSAGTGPSIELLMQSATQPALHSPGHGPIIIAIWWPITALAVMSQSARSSEFHGSTEGANGVVNAMNHSGAHLMGTLGSWAREQYIRSPQCDCEQVWRRRGKEIGYKAPDAVYCRSWAIVHRNYLLLFLWHNLLLFHHTIGTYVNCTVR
jgi:hypothetical protein